MFLKCMIVGCCFLGVGCAGTPPKGPQVSAVVEATRVPDPPTPVELVTVPQLLPLPGQLKPIANESLPPPENADPVKRVGLANELARVEPTVANFLNAKQVWPYNPDALYQIYSSPEKITDVALEAGEELISVSAGDTMRWIIGDTTSGAGSSQRVHILVKPTRPGLRTNLVINTNRRTYHLELSSTAQTWIASVSWQYPLDQLTLLKGANQRAQAAAPVTDGVVLENLNFAYEISGDRPAWRPIRAFDDGQKVYLQFPADIAQNELPPLFIISAKKQAELVNYRVRAPFYIVDRLFDRAELRLGGKNEVKVRIEHQDSRRCGTQKSSRT